MGDEILSGVLDALAAEGAETKRASSRATKVRKPPETIEDGFARVLSTKLSDAERQIVLDVQTYLRTGALKRIDNAAKLSKREVFELYEQHRINVRDAKRQHVIDTKPDNFRIVTDIFALHRLAELLQDEPITAWDTETTGLDIYNDKIVGWSVYLPNAGVAAYVPFGHTTGQTQVSEEAAMRVAEGYLTNPANKTLWHNYKYDGHLLLNHGITVANPYWDTQVVAKLLNENEPSNRLKDLYATYILGKPDEAVMFEDLFDDHTIYDKDIVLAGIYAAGDAHKTYKLYDFQRPYIDTRDNLKTVWYRIEQRLLQVDLIMERTGFRIDLDRVERVKTELTPVLEQSEKELLGAFNIDEAFMQRMADQGLNVKDGFNIQSPPHLAFLLYDHLGCDENLGLRFKKTKRSTAADVVEALCADHEELKPLLSYRKMAKLVGTYLESIPKSMEPATGRLHSRFNNMSADDGSDGTATGRYSSSEYCAAKHSKTGDHKKGTNLQNLPSKGVGSEVRRCFIPDAGWILLSADLSQIEPRVIAHILKIRFGDPSMADAYAAGMDIYVANAMRTFDLPREACLDGVWYDPYNSGTWGTGDAPKGAFYPRKLMKEGVLAYLYGQSAKAFARRMKVDESTGERFFAGMESSFPGLVALRASVIPALLRHGNIAHVETLYGRKRRFPDYRKNKAELDRLDKLPWKQRKADPAIDERRNWLWKYCAAVERQYINTMIQGTAADVIKMNMIALYERWVVGRGYKLHASIHDEVIPSVPIADLTPELIAELDDIMTKTVELAVPLKSDIVIMERWADEIKPDGWDFERGRPKLTAQEA